MKKITKIVTFYDDGTFTESVPSPGITPPYNPTPFMPTPVYPYTPSAPLNPSPYTQPWPSYPPYTITCGSTSGVRENLTHASTLMSDKGYSVSTHEKQAEFAKKREQQTCIECNKPATCVRHTQFAGDHPYCKEHGMQEEDYFVDDSYTYWTEL